MSDVFLLKLEAGDDPYMTAPPFGILYLASALENAGFSVRLIHEKGNPESLNRILGHISAERPLFVGISTITGPSLIPSLRISEEIKKKIDIPVVWGGIHPTMLPEQTLASSCVDIAVLGEGEETVVALAKSFTGGSHGNERFERIPGIALREKGRIIMNSPGPFIRELDSYSPAWHLLPAERYFYSRKFFLSDFGSRLPGERLVPYLTSRGCPWRCAYCYNQFVHKRTFRAHSAQKVIADLEQWKTRYGITAVVFEDDNLFTDKNRALEILHGIRLPWSSSLRASDISRWGDGFMRELKETGCVELRIGAESGSQRVLDLMKKDIRVEDIRSSVDLCLRHGIRALLNFMAGIPGETWKDMRATFDLMDELEAGGGDVVVNGPSLYCPWPGTALYEEAVAGGFRPPQRSEDWAVGWGHRMPSVPSADRRARYVGYYRILAFRKELSALRLPVFAKGLRFLARWRWRHRFFRFPLDYHVPNFFYRIMKILGLRSVAKALYH
ncbi:MAG: radical SAM protein [Acidobacteriota bacterium]|nr:radical SAM protein [Acidobacteriota bacterium]